MILHQRHGLDLAESEQRLSGHKGRRSRDVSRQCRRRDQQFDFCDLVPVLGRYHHDPYNPWRSQLEYRRRAKHFGDAERICIFVGHNTLPRPLTYVGGVCSCPVLPESAATYADNLIVARSVATTAWRESPLYTALMRIPEPANHRECHNSSTTRGLCAHGAASLTLYRRTYHTIPLRAPSPCPPPWGARSIAVGSHALSGRDDLARRRLGAPRFYGSGDHLCCDPRRNSPAREHSRRRTQAREGVRPS